MNKALIAKVLSIFFLSATKFLWAPGTAIVAGFSVFHTIFITSIGGMCGVSFFYFFGAIVIERIEKWRLRSSLKKTGNKPKVFTRRNRRIIRMKLSFGLIGLVIITPCLLSIPIGCAIAAKFYRHNKLTYPLLLVSTVLWSILLTVVVSLIESNITSSF